MREVRIGVIGATGAVGAVVLELLRERGFENVRAFASSRSAGSKLPDGRVVEEATPEALSAGELDLCLFSVGTRASKELVPHAARSGAVCIDKSAAFRLADGIPLVVPEVNGARALEHDGLRAVRVATYQSASGAGAQRLQRLLDQPQAEHDLAMDWDYDGEEFDEESKLRDETRKILELPELPLTATCVRVPVPVGHAESIWLETDEPLSPEGARELLAAADSVRVEEFPTPGQAAGGDEALVGRIRRDPAAENGLSLFLACDNLRKGAALNGIQIAELVLSRRAIPA
jgi:aspartate-semialdehyde dehydrogenase